MNEFVEAFKDGKEVEIKEVSKTILNQGMNEQLLKILDTDTIVDYSSLSK